MKATNDLDDNQILSGFTRFVLLIDEIEVDLECIRSAHQALFISFQSLYPLAVEVREFVRKPKSTDN